MIWMNNDATAMDVQWKNVSKLSYTIGQFTMIHNSSLIYANEFENQ